MSDDKATAELTKSNVLIGKVEVDSGTALSEVLAILCDIQMSNMERYEGYPRYANYFGGIRYQLQDIADKLPCWVIVSPDGSEYLRRYTISRMVDGSNVYLHEFRRGDLDSELHDHPWSGTSFILAGAYDEERRVTKDGVDTVERNTYKPGYVSHLRPDTFHRVDLINLENRSIVTTWTMFITGPKPVEDSDVHDSWGFWDRVTGKYTPWRTFMRQNGIVPLATPRPTENDSNIAVVTEAPVEPEYDTTALPPTYDHNATWWRSKCVDMERDVKAAVLALGGVAGSAYPELPQLAKNAASEVARLTARVRELEGEVTGLKEDVEELERYLAHAQLTTDP